MHSSLYELTANNLESIKENILLIDINKYSFEMNTIGIDFKTKKLNINNQEIKLKI